MRIRILFIILALLLLAIVALLIYDNQLHADFKFYIIEGLIFITLIYLIYFYRRVVKPLQIIGNGMELLREQDFSSRLKNVGQVEADHIVNIFNRMMEQMKNERLRMREQNHFLDLLIEASPMGVLIITLDDEVSQCNPMAIKMLGLTTEDIRGRKLAEINSPLAKEMLTIPRDQSKTVRLNDSNIYKCTHSSFINHGFPHSF